MTAQVPAGIATRGGRTPCLGMGHEPPNPDLAVGFIEENTRRTDGCPESLKQ